MKRFVKLLLCATLVLALVPVSLVLAEGETPVPSCDGSNVAGTVVAVDEETGVVTIDMGEGDLCTVTIAAGDYDHPIVALLGRYFGNVDADNLADALAATEVWVLCDSDGCTLSEEGVTGAVPGRVIGVTEDEDGFTLEIETDDGTVSVTTEDADLADELGDALDALAVDWELGEGDDGPVVLDASAQIAQLHEDGMGFGVIVKLYAIAAASQEECAEESAGEDGGAEAEAVAPEAGDEACGVTVEELVDAFQGGMGLGQLFHEFGKPAMLGVGHVRKAFEAQQDEDDEAAAETEVAGSPSDDKTCKDKKSGKGYGNPHCEEADTEPTSDEAVVTPANSAAGSNGGNGNGNGNSNGGGNGSGHGNGNGGGNGSGNGNGGGNGGGKPKKP